MYHDSPPLILSRRRSSFLGQGIGIVLVTCDNNDVHGVPGISSTSGKEPNTFSPGEQITLLNYGTIKLATYFSHVAVISIDILN